MRFNSKILSVIISLAFVGGMFTAVYAGPVIATITLDGNVHTTGDSIVDGDLSVGGVSFESLDARIAALESGTDTTVPMLSMVSDHGIMIDANLDAIAINALDIEFNADAIAQGGGGPNPCDPNGDGAITAQEVSDYMDSLGIGFGIFTVQSIINNIENVLPSPQTNGMLDTQAELAEFNIQILIPLGTTCSLP